ncbi:tRNA (adenine(22)-N(1))-methyltransferase [Levilactobacillus bambusae]|uniref:tRNA (Adenine(22)-N(1))-methyltransferase TrmK n=1 Tax=Levilactobacillus bambusae TaxID=2024736 RepID=A0A2V1N187_9LACO|nr:tRNA (adenine(22)-N(1))-methyltransferase TrmK [Levilactobacillus bambusae]PWG00783.1 tRNA (adenine(22)-N(1))-methyltransferase TrmK [Levilactobacillus bambusae]
MDADHLSDRLQTVARYIQPGARLADIGSDHAYLPVHLLKRGLIAGGIAGEVVRGPYENAKREIEREGLSGQLQPRLADGLFAIHPGDQIDTIAIAGMGGNLISTILNAKPDALDGVNRLVLQPNVGEEGLRNWLMTHQWQIIAEEILEEDGHRYEVIVAERANTPVTYTSAELQFGPFLLREKSPVFIRKWQREIVRETEVLDQIERAARVPAEKVNRLKQRISAMKEVLSSEG